MNDDAPSQLGRLVGLPLATIGVVSALLVWEVEHVGSLLLAGILAAGGLLVAVIVVRRVRRKIETLGDHYEALLESADESSRRAEAASRLKDEFLATLSHELRTPLNSVLGWARLLASGRLDAPQTRQAVQAIERAGWAQSRVIEDLLDMSQIVGGKLEIHARPVLLQPLVEAAVRSLQAAADAKRISVAMQLDPLLGAIAADADRLQQVVWNLVSNAIKFTPADGRIAVRLAAEGDQISLSVTDNGIGFKPEIAAYLFERFRQGDSSTTRQFGGLGLGLGIVRHLVELHGGTVTARSDGPDHGSTFEVRLPLRTASTFTTDVAPPTDPPFLRGVSVLVVDDDDAALEYARSTLEQYGANVVTATSAGEARETYLRAQPDVIVSDLRMPGEDGIELIRTIRALEETRGTHTPAAALTALVRSDDRRRALTAGYEMHVAKPIDPREFAAAIERLARDTDQRRSSGARGA